MAHVTLIRPPVLYPKFRPSSSVNAIPPLGLAYVAGALRGSGHEVTCVDAPGEAHTRFRICAQDPSLLQNGLNTPEIVARIPVSTEVIGISCMFSFDWFYIIELIREIRAKFPTQFLVLGGEHATADHDYILRTMPEVDACILGEGENKILGLLDALKRGVPKTDLPGVAVFDSVAGKVRKNNERDGEYRIRDVDSIPRPAWDLLPLRSYLDSGHGYGSLSSRAMPMLASRGCPHVCTFCSSPGMWTTRWKAREVSDVIDEIKSYVREYAVNRIEFYDLTLVIDKRWVLEFCRRLIDEKLGITWAMSSGTRTEALTPEVLALLKESGCQKLTYALETGNPEINLIIKKKIEYKRSLSSLVEAVRQGIVIKNTVILGFPFHTMKDVLLEYLFAIRLAWLGSNDIAFFSFSPYPGSELHDQLVAEGKIVKDENYPTFLKKVFPANFTNGMSWCPWVSGPGLQALCMLGMAQFYAFQYLFRPHRLFISAYRIFSGKPLTTLELSLTGVVLRAFRRSQALLPGEEGGAAA
jgi:radical SAM superfamily enzyme YgiQ (UPF0313 family)